MKDERGEYVISPPMEMVYRLSIDASNPASRIPALTREVAKSAREAATEKIMARLQEAARKIEAICPPTAPAKLKTDLFFSGEVALSPGFASYLKEAMTGAGWRPVSGQFDPTDPSAVGRLKVVSSAAELTAPGRILLLDNLPEGIQAAGLSPLVGTNEESNQKLAILIIGITKSTDLVAGARAIVANLGATDSALAKAIKVIVAESGKGNL
jgi:hypothetical protein